MWMAWGPELTFFCNDAYRRDTLGKKYPWALGRPAREVWAEIWPDIGPRIETVLRTGAGHLGRGAAAVPRAQRVRRGDLPHVLLQPARRRRRPHRGDAVRRQRGHRAGDRRAPAGDAARPRRRRSRPRVTEAEVLAAAARALGHRPSHAAVHARVPLRRGRRTPGRAQRRERVGLPARRDRGRTAEHAILVDDIDALDPADRRLGRAAARRARRPARRGPARCGFLVAGLNRYRRARRGLPRLPRARRRPDRRGHRERARLRGRAPARRGACWSSTRPRPRSSPTSATSCARR